MYDHYTLHPHSDDLPSIWLSQHLIDLLCRSFGWSFPFLHRRLIKSTYFVIRVRLSARVRLQHLYFDRRQKYLKWCWLLVVAKALVGETVASETSREDRASGAASGSRSPIPGFITRSTGWRHTHTACTASSLTIMFNLSRVCASDWESLRLHCGV
jgi:hypothetical protein